jgi:hypothetical protein
VDIHIVGRHGNGRKVTQLKAVTIVHPLQERVKGLGGALASDGWKGIKDDIFTERVSTRLINRQGSPGKIFCRVMVGSVDTCVCVGVSR